MLYRAFIEMSDGSVRELDERSTSRQALQESVRKRLQPGEKVLAVTALESRQAPGHF